MFGILRTASYSPSSDFLRPSSQRHIGPLGHDALGDQLTLYMREQVCETRRREAFPPPAHDPRWPQADILGVVPRLVMWEGYSETKVAPPVTPTCAFAGSQRKPLDTVPELTTSEWQMESWNGKSAIGAHEVGAKVAFRFRGTKGESQETFLDLACPFSDSDVCSLQSDSLSGARTESAT